MDQPTKTCDSMSIEPLDSVHEVLRAEGKAYKTKSGVWTDGGTDDHIPNGTPRAKWKGIAPLETLVLSKRHQLATAIAAMIGIHDIAEIFAAQLARAKTGDRFSAELILKYTVGDPIMVETLQRLRMLEAAAGMRNAEVETREDENTNSMVLSLRAKEDALRKAQA